jgi:hypothetical protein
MEIIENIMETIFSLLIGSLFFVPILGFFKVATVKSHIEGDSNIIRYILKNCEDSTKCTTFLLEHGYQSPLTKKYLKTMLTNNREDFFSLVNELNVIINREAYLKSKNSEK